MKTLVYTVNAELTVNRTAALKALELQQPVAVRFGLDGTEAVLRSFKHIPTAAPRVNPTTRRILPRVRTLAASTGVHYILTCDGKQEAMRAENWRQAMHRAELRCCSDAAGIRQHDENRTARRPI